MARELSIEVTANTAQAEASLAKVETAITGIEAAAPAAATGVQKVGKEVEAAGVAASKTEQALALASNAIARFAAPIAIGDSIRRTLEFADNISDLSRRTGIGTTALQQFGQVARMNGQSVDQVALAVQKLGERLSSGDKSAVESMGKLGLNTQALLAMNPEDRFRTWAEAISKVSDNAKAAELAQDGIGRSALTLLGTIKDIGEAADRYIPVLGEKFIEAGSQMQDQIDLLIHSTKTFIELLILGLPAGAMAISQWTQSWADANNMVLMGGSNSRVRNQFALPNPMSSSEPGALNNEAMIAGLFAPRGAGVPGTSAFLTDPRTGRVRENPEFDLMEKDLGRQLIEAKERGRQADLADLAARVKREEELNFRLYQNAQALASHTTPMDWQMNPRDRPFPGWAVPMEAIPSTHMNLMDPTLWSGSGAGMLRPPLMEVRPNGPSPGMLQRMRGNPLANFAMSQMFSFLPGMSNAGSSFGGGLGQSLGQVGGIANALGGFASFLGPIGGLVGGLVGRLFGPSQATQTRRQRDSFVEDFGGMDQLQAAASHAGFSLDALFNTRKVKDFEAEVKKLNEALKLQELRDALKEVSDGFIEAAGGMDRLNAQAEVLGFNMERFRNAGTQQELSDAIADFEERLHRTNDAFAPLLARANELGSRLPEALEQSLRQLRDMGVLVGDNATMVDRLLSRTAAVDWQTMQGIANQLGIPNEALGGIFNQGRIGAGAGDLVNQLDTLRRGGGDIGGILNTESVRNLFQQLGGDAIRNNVALPENLRQYFEELARVGQLGQVDPFMLQFGPAITTEFEQNTAAINALIASLSSGPMVEALQGGPLIAALNNFPREFDIRITTPPGIEGASRGGGGDVNVTGGGGIDEGGGAEPVVGVSRGGLILGPGRVRYFGRGGKVHGDYYGFDPIGTDTVPAMLTPGEAVLTPDQTANFASLITAMQQGEQIGNPVDLGGGSARDIESGQVLVVAINTTKDPDAEHIMSVVEQKWGRRAMTGKIRASLDQLYQRKVR